MCSVSRPGSDEFQHPLRRSDLPAILLPQLFFGLSPIFGEWGRPGGGQDGFGRKGIKQGVVFTTSRMPLKNEGDGFCQAGAGPVVPGTQDQGRFKIVPGSRSYQVHDHAGSTRFA